MTATETPRRYPAGSATFSGDQSHMIGEVKGPTTFGTMLVAVRTEYNATSDRTRVHFVTTLDDDPDRAEVDEHGVIRLPIEVLA